MTQDPKSGPVPSLPQLDGVGITPQPEPDPAPRSEILGEEDEAASSREAPPLDLPIVITHENSPPIPDRDVARLFVRAYTLIAGALMISALVAALAPMAAADPERMADRQLGVNLLFLFEIACVAVFTRYVPRLPRKAIAALLVFFAVINGISFTVFLRWITPAALACGFLLIGLSFATTALLAHVIDLDLTSFWGVMLTFGTGIVLIAVLTYGLKLDGDWGGAGFAGFMLFAGLSCFFMEDIADLECEFDDDRSRWKAALCAALILYLNFVNLYLVTMRILYLGAAQLEEDTPEAMARRRLRSW